MDRLLAQGLGICIHFERGPHGAAETIRRDSSGRGEGWLPCSVRCFRIGRWHRFGTWPTTYGVYGTGSMRAQDKDGGESLWGG